MAALSIGACFGVACAKFAGDDGPGTPDAGGPADGPQGPRESRCRGQTTFVADGAEPWATGVELKSARLGSDGAWYVSHVTSDGASLERRAPDRPLVPIANVGASGAKDEQAVLAADGAALIFQSDRTSKDDALYVAARGGAEGTFGAPQKIAVPDSVAATDTQVQDPYLVGSSLYYARNVKSGRVIVQAKVAIGNGTATVSGPLPVVLGGYADHPTVTANELEIFFAFKLLDTGESHIVHASRAAATQPFGPVEDVVMPPGSETPSWLSPDGCDLWVIDDERHLKKLTREPK